MCHRLAESAVKILNQVIFKIFYRQLFELCLNKFGITNKLHVFATRKCITCGQIKVRQRKLEEFKQFENNAAELSDAPLINVRMAAQLAAVSGLSTVNLPQAG